LQFWSKREKSLPLESPKDAEVRSVTTVEKEAKDPMVQGSKVLSATGSKNNGVQTLGFAVRIDKV
jgi:hypothetical protein